MKKYNKLEVSSDIYEKIKTTQKSNNAQIREFIHGSRKKLFIHNKLIATTSVTSNLDLGGLSEKQFVSFLGLFNKHLYSTFLKNPEFYDLKIKFTGVAREKNAGTWRSMKEGTYFYNIDLSSAYWQIAHKLKYITTKFFETYHDVDSYKQAKRYCISFLARKSKVLVSTPNNEYEIQCDNSPLQRVYDNIRNELYSCVNVAKNSAKTWIEYNIDGVTVMSDDVNAVCREFKDMGLAFKITECRKISESEYVYGSQVRTFLSRNLKTEIYE